MDKKINLKSLLPLPEIKVYILLTLYEPRTVTGIIRLIKNKKNKDASLKPEFVDKVIQNLLSNHLIVKTLSTSNLDNNTSEFIISPLGKEIIVLEEKRLTNLIGNIRKVTISKEKNIIKSH